MGTKDVDIPKFGGARRDRTADLLHAMQALSQLSYSPTERALYGGWAGLSRTPTVAVYCPTNQPLAAALASISPIAWSIR